MAPKRRDLMAKAHGMTVSIAKITGNERTYSPSASFGDDYNRLRQAAAQMYPGIESILPPAVEIERSHDRGGPFTKQRYSEIQAFCEQIYQVLGEQADT